MLCHAPYLDTSSSFYFPYPIKRADSVQIVFVNEVDGLIDPKAVNFSRYEYVH
jgi:hypothetical protein